MSRFLARVAWRAGLLALGLCLAACGEDVPDEPPGPPARLAVGTGLTFTALEEGATLELIQGCQGSQHAFVSLQAWELTSLTARVELSLERTSNGDKVSNDYKVLLDFEEPLSAGEPALLEGLLLVVPDPNRAVGQEVRLKASILSESNQRATDLRTATLQWGTPTCP
ncbi:MAG: hypothetical protein JXB05_10265 [Myxococcaceae bacterium]|nr:hypothetical protein [Myxococcaceae bacterium]